MLEKDLWNRDLITDTTGFTLIGDIPYETRSFDPKPSDGAGTSNNYTLPPTAALRPFNSWSNLAGYIIVSQSLMTEILKRLSTIEIKL